MRSHSQDGAGIDTGDRPARLRRSWSDEEWDALLRDRPEATFFHTRTWARIVLASFPSLSDASLWMPSKRAPCLLPLYSWRRAFGLLATYHSSFPFLYGGPVFVEGASADGGSADGGSAEGMAAGDVAADDIDAHDRAANSNDASEWMRAALSVATGSFASIRLTGNPFDLGMQTPTPTPCEGFSLRMETTHLLDLPPTPEAYWDKLAPSKRNDVRRLAKKGVVIEETRDPALAEGLYRMYVDSFERWGGRPAMVYPQAFYRNLLLLGGDAVRLTVALHRGRLLGGTFAIRWNGIVHYLAGYFDHASRALRPNVLIQIESIQQAIRDGFRRYDFLPSGGIAAVETFKESFGGRAVRFPVWERTGALRQLLGRAARLRGAPQQTRMAHWRGGNVAPG